MSNWDSRSIESKILLNPAFTGLILYTFIDEYTKLQNRRPHYAELYLVLPIVLHNETRAMIPPRIRKKMRVWISENAKYKVSFPKRAIGLKTISDEAILFLSNQGKLNIDNQGLVYVNSMRVRSKVIVEEIADILRVTKILAKWFGEIQDVEQKFRLWGVKP